MLSLRDFLFIYSLPFFHSGSSFTKKCLAFVPKTGQSVDPIWYVRDFKASNKTSERIYVSEKRSAHSSCLLTFLFTCFDKLTVWGGSSRRCDAPAGLLVERLLIFSELREDDFNLNYTCLVQSSRVQPPAYFTLIPAGTWDILFLFTCFLCLWSHIFWTIAGDDLSSEWQIIAYMNI